MKNTNTIQVEILPDGMAIEVNPLGDEPIKFSGFTMAKIGIPTYEWKQWQLAESQRRVFKIVGQMHYDKIEHGKFHDLVPFTLYHDKKEGDTCTAEIVNEKEVIIK